VLLVTTLLFASLGCEPTVPEGRFACQSDADCPDEMVCRPQVRRCYRSHADAGTPSDAGAPADTGANGLAP
jgi:hypothetical protein